MRLRIIWLMALVAWAACQPSIDVPPPDTNIPVDYIQTYTLSPNRDTTLTTAHGATLVIPACAFSSSKPITLQLTEAYGIKAFAELGLTSETTDGQLLESGGMFYLYATDENGKALAVEQHCSPLMNYPSTAVLPDAQRYEGERIDGKVRWKVPAQPLPNWLTPVPLPQLEFRAPRDGFSTSSHGHHPAQLPSSTTSPTPSNSHTSHQITTEDYCGLDDIVIDQLAQPAYNLSFVATLEFEERVQLLHKACSEKGLYIYLEHLDKPLYYSDSLVHKLLKDNNQLSAAKHFYCFYLQKKTNVERQQSVSKAYLQQAKALVEQHREQRNKREAILYTRFEFDRTATWYNIDRVIAQNLEVHAFEEKAVLAHPDLSDEQLASAKVLCLSDYTKAIQWLYLPLSSSIFGNTCTNYTTSDDFAKDQPFTLFAYLMDGESAYMAKKAIRLGTDSIHELTLAPTSMEKIYRQLERYGKPLPQFQLPNDPTKGNCCEHYTHEDYELN